MESFEPFLSRAVHCPEEIFDEILRSTPPAWIEGEEDDWHRVLEKLFHRRKKIADLLLATIRARPQAFPSWRG